MGESVTDSDGEAVPHKSAISTYEMLRSLGFNPDTGIMSDIAPGLSFDFGNLTLTASACLGRHFRNVVLVTGVFKDARSIVMVEYELPDFVSSNEQGKALLAYALDKPFGTKGFNPSTTPEWLTDGRKFKCFLPWEMKWAKERDEEARRPRCTVERDWLRLGLKTLGQQLEGQSSEGVVYFNFDGGFFSIGGPGTPLMLPATGDKPWPQTIRVPIKKLNLLPRRLMTCPVVVAVYPDSLKIDRVRIPRLPPTPSDDED